MGDKSSIEWTEATWNPVTGCTKVSEGCRNCYAKFQAWPRLAANPSTIYHGRKFEEIAWHPERFDQPIRWKRPRRIFVNSMSDLFHESIPDVVIAQIFSVMEACPQHVFQALTKRPERMLDWTQMVDDNFLGNLLVGEEDPAGKDWTWSHWPLPNVWLGVSVETQETAEERVPMLLQTTAAIRWLSCEPLLGPIVLTDEWLQKLNWVVVGGESGKEARPMHPDWPRRLRDQCEARHDMCRPWQLPFFFKQWGEWWPLPIGKTLGEYGKPAIALEHEKHNEIMVRIGKKKAGRFLDGRLWNEYPGVGRKIDAD